MTGGKIEIEITDGRKAEMMVPAPAPNRDSVFVFAIHKSGSVLLDNIVRDLCAAAKVPTVSIDLFCFNGGLPIEKVTAASTAQLFNSDGYCFSGFRGVHPCLAGVDLASRRKIVLVRDPRDALTSFYFSMAKSHAIPAQGEMRDRMLATRERASRAEIQDYVVSPDVTFIANNFRKYIALDGPTTKVYRYEDVIFSKQDWVTSIAEWFSLDVSEERRREIARKHDIRPESENPDRHIRQVTPGNYKTHLSSETIEKINSTYKDIMLRYGYKR